MILSFLRETNQCLFLLVKLLISKGYWVVVLDEESTGLSSYQVRLKLSQVGCHSRTAETLSPEAQ